MKAVRVKMEEINFINKEKDFDDFLDLVFWNSSTLKKKLHNAQLMGDESEASNTRNQFLRTSKRYIDSMSDFVKKLKMGAKITLKIELNLILSLKSVL